ncbi:hypothetical protein K440DRAFT_610472 [Wilcoxina mikolae CBS 423.85]|nr:hypothetical protein K440DRAFT_610472 [Wilcoxina mikolae CBS 423.85]
MSAISHLAHVPVLMLLSVNEIRSEAKNRFPIQANGSGEIHRNNQATKEKCSRYLYSLVNMVQSQLSGSVASHNSDPVVSPHVLYGSSG